ncbi:MAG TPA: BatD family protein, partial [Sedimentisphaerales bacterium]|nr:BatD family protein [Sedimentisphaerales bacterium]
KIVFEGVNQPGEVDLTPLEKFNPQSGGTSSSTQIVNGRTSQKVELTYYLAANEPGQLELPALTVTYDGKKYQTEPITINVLKPETTDKMLLSVTLSDKKCYVGQPVIMSVEWIILTEVKNAGFNVPIFSSDDFYFEDTASDDNADSQNTHPINGVVVQLKEERKTYKNASAAIISFKKVLIPKKEGKIEIPPSSVSAAVAVGVTRSRDFWGNAQYQYKQFMVSSDSLSLEVLPLPAEEKPAEFYGLLGKYNISASATPTKVSVGDPITLTIKIGGNPFLKPVKWPDLEAIGSLKNNFKIPDQRSSPVIENGYKVFTQTIRANNEKVTEIPPIPLAFFDPDDGKYKTIMTEAIKLEVAPTKILTGADVEGLNFSPANKQVEAIKKGLSANYENPEVLINQHFSFASATFSPVYFIIWFLPLLVLAASFSFKVVTYTNPEKIAVKRRQSAAKKAISQLKKINDLDNQQKYELTAAAMTGFIGDRFNKIAGSLTSDDCYRIIAEKTDETKIAERFKIILSDCQACRYASVQTNIDPVKVTEIMNLISVIDKKSKKTL